MTSAFSEKSLGKVAEDLQQTLPQLANLLYVLQPSQGQTAPDLPVAFATNTLYVLERNGLGERVRDTYENLLIPIIRNKAEYLHAEGVAQAVWALSNAEMVEDQELWSTLKQAVLNKNFTPVFVKNERWSATLFSTHSNSEHLFQSELSEFADQLFFQDHMNLFEVYNGLKKANSLNRSLGLEDAIKHLEQRYSDVILRKND